MSILYVVVPCYNEQEVLPEAIKRLTKKLGEMIQNEYISAESKLLFVDDGSSDATWEILCENYEANEKVCAIKLSHNQGHQNALLAGLMSAKESCDCAISIDADLQDDINVMDEFVEKFRGGCDVVYGVRKKRAKDSFFKRTTAQSFYKFMKLMGVDIIYNHADYRLMSRTALEALDEYKEVNLFLRGVVRLLGYKSGIVYYERSERYAGTSKYPLKKMLHFAVDGITSFSIKPLRLISTMGIIIALMSSMGILYALISKFFFPTTTISGWTAIVASIWFVGGIQLLCIGVVGEYIGKVYSEVKKRPHYIVEKDLKK